MDGFDTLVGQITNNSTSLNAMLPLFPQDKYPEQHEELLNRLKLLREIIGAEIDKIKLGVSPEFPSEWLNKEIIEEDDSDQEKADKYKRNSMVICKKPYFMIYLYNNLYNSYKNHEKQFNIDCKNKYNISLNDLRNKKDKTDSEIKFIKRADYFSPALDTNCTMNIICHKFEKIEEDIVFDKSFNHSILPEFNNHNFEIDSEKLDNIDLIYKEYKARRKFSYVKELMKDALSKDEFGEYVNSMIKHLISEFKQRCIDDISSNIYEIYEYMMALYLKYNECGKNFDFNVVWDLLDDDIINIIPKGNTIVYTESNEGKEYLGKFYTQMEVVE